MLEKREELLEQVFEEAKSRISEVTKDESKYGELLKSLILQALFTMMEKDIKVSGRPKDSNLLEKAAEEAAKEFEDKVGYKPKIEVDQELGDKSNGGVLLKGYGSRIVVNNTLDERLRLLEERMLPEIRESLFGKNENRRVRSSLSLSLARKQITDAIVLLFSRYSSTRKLSPTRRRIVFSTISLLLPNRLQYIFFSHSRSLVPSVSVVFLLFLPPSVQQYLSCLT